jgi:hypothetical protein
MQKFFQKSVHIVNVYSTETLTSRKNRCFLSHLAESCKQRI